MPKPFSKINNAVLDTSAMYESKKVRELFHVAAVLQVAVQCSLNCILEQRSQRQIMVLIPCRLEFACKLNASDMSSWALALAWFVSLHLCWLLQSQQRGSCCWPLSLWQYPHGSSAS